MIPRIKEHRDLRGIDIDELAYDADVPVMALVRIERGERHFDRDIAERVAAVFGVHPTELLADPASMGWWPISDLPAGYVAVLLWDGSDVSIGVRVIGSHDEMQAFTESGEVTGPFTHWMPLPSPPKKMSEAS